MSIIYHEEDGDLGQLVGRTIGVIGYGKVGRAMALNLRDSGQAVFISETHPERAEAARAEGFDVLPTPDLARRAQILMLLVPDEIMPEIYLTQVSPALQRGHMLLFSSAYNIAFGYIEPPPFVDVGLIAPRTLGAAVREYYLNGTGFVSFVAVGQDASGGAWPVVLAMARAVGSLRAGAIEIAFEREAELDLFMQQALMPAVHHVLVTAAQLLMDAGYPPEAIFTDLYLSGEFADYLARASAFGLLETLRQAPLTAQYGTFSRMERFADLKLQRLMEVTLDEIREGNFAREWAREYTDGARRLQRLIKAQDGLDLWEMEQQTLELLRRADEH